MKTNLELFKKYLVTEHKSTHTIKSYLIDIEQFLRFNNDEESIINEMFIKDKIKEYKEYLKQEKYKPKTINRKLISIETFLKYMDIHIKTEREFVQNDGFLNNVLSNEDVYKMISKAIEQNDIRAKTLMYTLYYTGLRISEILQFTIGDLNKDFITVECKGGVVRTVLIPKKLQKIWKDYIPFRINKGNKLFTGKRGGINRKTASTIISQYGKLANIDKNKCHCHNFRHLFCKNLANKNISIDTIADIMGHKSMEATRIYTRKSQSELLSIMNNL